MKRLIISDVKSLSMDGKSVGHYFSLSQNYLDLYSDYFDVKVAGGPIYHQQFQKKDYFPLPNDFIEGENWFKNKLRVLKNCRYLFKKTDSNDIIIIQQAGLSTVLLGIALYAKKKSNICIIAYDTDAISSKIKKIICYFAKPKIKAIICPTDRILNAYKIKGCVVTDYIYAKKNVCTFIPYEKREYDIAILGRICAEKGVLEAAKYLANTKYKILIAGKPDKELISSINNICKSSSNIKLILDFISDEDYYNYIRHSRYCLLNYHGTYNDRSSGVVLDNLFNGTPILGHNCQALSFIKKEKLGYLFEHINDLDLDGIINKNMHEMYIRNIINYLQKQKMYKKKVIDFFNSDIFKVY